MKKPREWTLIGEKPILTGDRGCLEPRIQVVDGPLITDFYDKPDRFGMSYLTPEVKVIEKSAYDELEKELDKTTECLIAEQKMREKADEERRFYKNEWESCCERYEYQKELVGDYQKAVKVLKNIRKMWHNDKVGCLCECRASCDVLTELHEL